MEARRAHNPEAAGSNPAPATKILRPYGQAVKTPPFHGDNPGSSPGRVIFLRKLSSVGRASALQAGGHRFEPYSFHFLCSNINYGLVVQLVRMPACHAGGRGFEPLPGRHAGVAQLVEQLTCNQ